MEHHCWPSSIPPHLLWWTLLRSDNIFSFKPSGTCVFKPSQLKTKYFYFCIFSFSKCLLWQILQKCFLNNTTQTLQKLKLSIISAFIDLNPMYHNCSERLVSCEITSIITTCHIIHIMLFNQHNYLYPHRHSFSVITAYMKINLGWKHGKKSMQNNTSNLPTLQRCLPICTHHFCVLPTEIALTVHKFL